MCRFICPCTYTYKGCFFAHFVHVARACTNVVFPLFLLGEHMRYLIETHMNKVGERLLKHTLRAKQMGINVCE